MFKYAALATTAMLLAAPAFAQVVPAIVELEGRIEGYDHPSRTLTVMGMQVQVLNTTDMHTPTATRQEAGLNNNQWFKGEKFPGRRQAGFLGGTAIVIGVWDDINGRIVAQDIFSEPGENVILGVVTQAKCTTAFCDGPNDYIRGNSAPGSLPGALIPGPAMIPIKKVDGSGLPDPRMPYEPIKDEGGFELNLTDVNLDGLPFAAEGYYGDIVQNVPDGLGGTTSELAFNYFIWDVADLAPALLARKTEREIAALRTSCADGDRFEMRGNIHSKVTPTGVLDDTITPDSGQIVVRWLQGGVEVRRTAVPTPLDIGSPYGGFRVRFDIPVCPSAVDVYWMQNVNTPVGAVNATAGRYARQLDVPVEVAAP